MHFKYREKRMKSWIVEEPNEGFVRLRFNRTKQKNAMNAAMRDSLREVLERARNKFRVIVLTGMDDVFCGGIDLKEVAQQASENRRDALADWRDINAAIREHPSVFIAQVNGIALGGGVTLTGVCDLAIAASDAAFGMPEVGFGMYPNPAGPASQMTLGRKRASWLVLTAERISASTAEAWGLINETVPAGALESRVNEIAARVGSFDAATLTACKRMLDKVPLNVSQWRNAFDAGEQANLEITTTSDEANIGLTRFAKGQRNIGQG